MVFNCEICNGEFTEKRNLNTHLNSVHSKKFLSVDIVDQHLIESTIIKDI